MRRWITCSAVLFGLVFTLPHSAPACSLCDSALKSQTPLRQELEAARLVLYGTVANPQFNKKPGSPPGSGSTEFYLLHVVRNDPALGSRSKLEIPRYLPVLDPKNPPKYLVFCSVKDGEINPYHGRQVESDAVLAYLNGVLGIIGKDRNQQLAFFFKYLDNPDKTISADAFLEFARCNDLEIGEVAKHLPADKLRQFLQDPKTPTERLGLYAFMLGAGGNDKDAAALLRNMIENPNDRTAGAMDGLLSGYIHMRPREGWDLAAAILGDSKKPFSQRFAVSRTLRFYHAWKPVESKNEVLRCLAVMIDDGQIADMAIEDLREWKMWDLTKQVLALYGKPSHNSPIAQRNIVRYALCCPLPESQQFVAKVRQQDPELVRDLEEGLEFEKGK
jgi:hypothetical protein